MTPAPILLSFCGESKNKNADVNLLLMGYDVKNPAIKSVLKRCNGDSQLLGSILTTTLAKTQALKTANPLIQKTVAPLVAKLDQKDTVEAVKIAVATNWKAEAGKINWAQVAAGFDDSRVYPVFTGSPDDLAYVRMLLTLRKDFNAYFNPNYSDVNTTPDAVLIQIIINNPLLWKMTAAGNYGTPVTAKYPPVQTIAGKIVKAIASPILTAVGAVIGVPGLGMAAGKVVSGIIKTPGGIAPGVVPHIVAAVPVTGQPLTFSTKLQIFLKQYFGL